jgi:hypothetical protein
MSKRIAIIPCFGDGHFTKFQIENLVNTIKPDVIIYNEGLFPQGPENKGGMDLNFRSLYCHNQTNLAWDTEIVQSAIKEAQQKYPEIKIFWNEMNYKNPDCNVCYVEAVSNFTKFGVDIQPGDIIFPLEGDVFFHQDYAQELERYLQDLKPNEGLRAPYLDFMENESYVEGSALDASTIHYRRIAIKFGDWDYYKNIVINFMSQRYPLTLFPQYIFHYPWWKPGKYKDMRVALLKRDDQYHKNFLSGLDRAKLREDSKIAVRPNRSENDPMRYIVKIDIDHPIEIREHQNYCK